MNTLTLLFLAGLLACDRSQPDPDAPIPRKGDRTTAAAPKSSGGGPTLFSDQDCSDRTGAGVAPADGCSSGTLRCGETITGHTEGGGSRFQGPFYVKKFCEALVDPYLGEERVYRFRMERDQLATLTLTSDCEDLDLFVLQWSDDGCPGMGHMINVCEADVGRKGGEIDLESITNPRSFIVVVEGKGGVDAPFALSASCRSRSGP